MYASALAAVHHAVPTHTLCSPNFGATPPACLLSHPSLHSSSLINTHPPVPWATPGGLSWTQKLPKRRAAWATPVPSLVAPVLTGFVLLGRWLLLRFLLLLLQQPYLLQQAHQAAAQGGFFLRFFLLPRQLNSWRWSRREGMSFIIHCLLIASIIYFFVHSCVHSLISHSCVHSWGFSFVSLYVHVCSFIHSLNHLSFKSTIASIFKELKETKSKVLKRTMMTMSHQTENINRRR